MTTAKAAPKQSPKPPAVKAPEGWHWEKNVRGEFQLSKLTRSDTFSVPWEKEVRDAMLACVIAYDLRGGTESQWMTRDSSPGKQFVVLEVSE